MTFISLGWTFRVIDINFLLSRWLKGIDCTWKGQPYACGSKIYRAANDTNYGHRWNGNKYCLHAPDSHVKVDIAKSEGCVASKTSIGYSTDRLRGIPSASILAKGVMFKEEPGSIDEHSSSTSWI